VLKLIDELKLNGLQVSDMCLQVTGLPPKDARNSERATRALLEHLQTKVLDRQKGAA